MILPKLEPLFIESPTTTTGNGIWVANASNLSTGGLAFFHSDSGNVSPRDLISIINANALAVDANALMIQNNGAGDADAGVTIKFNNTPAANANSAVSSWTVGQTIQGNIKINIDGTTRFIRFYDAPTS